MKYVLITPARNEEACLESTIASVCAQTHRPERWVIVDDGSTDRTAEIVLAHSKTHPWITLVQRPQHADRTFAAKVQAFNAGYETVIPLSFDVIGNLDADISFDPDYMEFLMSRFADDPRLGVAGTPFTQDNNYDSARDSFEGESYVAGGCQLFRLKCFQEVGGYVPVRGGGIDVIAVMTARMRGWTVRCFPEKRFHHYRILGTAQRGVLGAMFDYGRRAYALGSSPVWMGFRVIYRIPRKPFLLGSLALFGGYFTGVLKRAPRPVSSELMRFHRHDQMRKLKAIFRSLLTFQKVDTFRVGASVAPANKG